MLALLAPSLLRAQQPKGTFTWDAQVRVRAESWNWFEPPAGVAGDHQYGFFAATAHGIAGYDSHRWFDARLDVQNTSLLNLPEQSNVAPPAGDLGLGATYFAVHHEANLSRFFVNQAYLTLKRPSHPATFLRLGRLEFQDGLETMTGNATLDWLKRVRLGARLISTVGFTHGGRSYDGAMGTYDRSSFALSGLLVHPRQGLFEPEGMPSLTEVDLGSVAATIKPRAIPHSEVRAFYLYYADHRSPADTVIKVDNRPAPARAVDSADITLHQFGLHAVTAFPLGGGEVDLLAWGVIQRGDWGLLRHRASAIALEAGYQPRTTWKPWIRAGYFLGSGDRDPADQVHGTYFITLYTSRQFAQFPFYNAMNSRDVFAQLILRPVPGKLTIRSDFHDLHLAQSSDLWYSGSGPFVRRGNFGVGGKPSGGNEDLARTLDLGVTWDPSPRWTVYGYVGSAWGGAVPEFSYGSSTARFGYLELTARF
jgi:hypothetical protein